jgi:osmotically-inducible protein OsmY
MNGRALALLLLMLVVAGIALGALRPSPVSNTQSRETARVVTPAAAADDDLRRAIARAIYGHPTFWRAAALPQPPIHVSVENGVVTLTGVVAGELERALAGSLARGHGERAVANRLRTRAAGIN